ncbi:MAG: iron ABC transporter permease [Victivallaceae bacterium]|nr:iron ABC transporter permease [Victivallaceae bacterium]
MTTRRCMQYAALAAIIIFFAVFLLLPVLTVVRDGLNWHLLAEVCRNYVYVEGLLNSFAVAGVTTIMVFCIALPLALAADRYDFPLHNLSTLAVMLPMILPPFVGALGFQQMLGHYGVVNTILTSWGFAPVDFLGGDGRFWSVCAIEALHLYPILYLNLSTALGNIDPALNEAARNCGASRLMRFRRVTLPLLRPGVLAGGSIVLVWSFTELGTPLMFGYDRVTPVQIFSGITELETNPVPYALVVIMLVFSALMYAVGKFALGGTSSDMKSKGLAGSGSVRLPGWKAWLPTLLFAAVTLLAALPHLALLLSSFSLRWYGTLLPENFSLLNFENALGNKLVLPSIANSLKYSSIATVFAVAAGTATALAAVRWKLKGGALADLLAMLPLAVPGIVIAFGYLGMSVKYDWAARCFNPMENPLWLLAAAYAVRRVPYVVRAVSSGLEQTSEELENAARCFGAGPWRTAYKVTLPLITANLVVGALFAFSFSMLEVSDSLILAQKSEFFPITRTIYELSQILGSGPLQACAFGVWAMLFLAATIGGAGMLLGSKLGSVFKL